ncbi:Odorant receptor Or90 [Rhyzopertha dominica]|nr:Odorant receptor Or90 [Rhyzopertha dominica]
MATNPEPYTDEYLPFLRKTMMLYYENAFVRMLCKIYLPLYFLMHATMMVDCFIHERKTDHLFNTVVLTSCVHVMVTLVLVESVYKDIMNMDELMSEIFWSQNGAPKWLKQNIHQLSQTFKILLFVGLFGVIVLCVSAVLFRIHPDWPIIDKSDPIHYAIFLVAFMIHNVVACVIVFVYSCMFFYACIHVYVQMALLTEHLKKLSGEDGLDELIKERMLPIIKQHCKLSGFAKKVTQTFSPKRLATPLSTAMFSFSICLYLIMKRREYSMVIFLISFFIIPALYCVTGELFSFGFEKFSFELYNCCWYGWNKENMRTVLLFLVFTQREQVVQVFPSLYARMRYILWTVKTLYTVLTLFKSIQF